MSPRGGRSARSFSDTITAVMPCATWACGATCSQLFIEPRLVGLDVTERDPPQRLDRDDPGDRGGYQREQLPVSGVEQQWFVGDDEVLVEGHAGRLDEGRDAVDAVGDLHGGRFHGGLRSQ